MTENLENKNNKSQRDPLEEKKLFTQEVAKQAKNFVGALLDPKLDENLLSSLQARINEETSNYLNLRSYILKLDQDNDDSLKDINNNEIKGSDFKKILHDPRMLGLKISEKAISYKISESADDKEKEFLNNLKSKIFKKELELLKIIQKEIQDECNKDVEKQQEKEISAQESLKKHEEKQSGYIIRASKKNLIHPKDNGRKI